jgi:hypothetical protein
MLVTEWQVPLVGTGCRTGRLCCAGTALNHTQGRAHWHWSADQQDRQCSWPELLSQCWQLCSLLGIGCKTRRLARAGTGPSCKPGTELALHSSLHGMSMGLMHGCKSQQCHHGTLNCHNHHLSQTPGTQHQLLHLGMCKSHPNHQWC